jgi:hypothetical protein
MMRLPMNPSQTRAGTVILRNRLPSARPVASTSGRGVAGDDQLQQFHHMGGGEEVQADDARGVLRVAAISSMSR